VVDGGKARVILPDLVTKADVKDNQPMLDLLWHTNLRLKLRPHHVTGNSVYGTTPNVKAVEQAGIRAYMPVIDYTWGKRALFRKDDFVYDAERDVYWCPAGEKLRNTGRRKELGITRYVVDAFGEHGPRSFEVATSARPVPFETFFNRLSENAENVYTGSRFPSSPPLGNA